MSDFNAQEYLIRNVLKPAFPGIVPLDDLAGVCTQVDHLTASQREAISKVYAILWSVITDDDRIHTARRVLLAALGGVGSTNQSLAIQQYAEPQR